MDPVGEIVGQYQALWLFATILAAQRQLVDGNHCHPATAHQPQKPLVQVGG
jgi:hypothetical protein